LKTFNDKFGATGLAFLALAMAAGGAYFWGIKADTLGFMASARIDSPSPETTPVAFTDAVHKTARIGDIATLFAHEFTLETVEMDLPQPVAAQPEEAPLVTDQISYIGYVVSNQGAKVHYFKDQQRNLALSADGKSGPESVTVLSEGDTSIVIQYGEKKYEIRK